MVTFNWHYCGSRHTSGATPLQKFLTRTVPASDWLQTLPEMTYIVLIRTLHPLTYSLLDGLYIGLVGFALQAPKSNREWENPARTQ